MVPDNSRCSGVREPLQGVERGDDAREMGLRAEHLLGRVPTNLLVALFGAGKKEQLNAVLDDVDVTIFNNAVSNRHDVAHSAGSQITLLELKKALFISEKILAAIKNAIA